MTEIEKTLDCSGAFPQMPRLDSGKVREWIELIQRISEQFREEDGKRSQYYRRKDNDNTLHHLSLRSKRVSMS